MFEPRARDGPARVGSWEIADTELGTPQVLWVDTDRVPAPDFAEILLAQREPDGDRPWVRDAGSAFSKGSGDLEGRPVLTIPRDLPYYPAGGMQLMESADEVNRRLGDEVFVATTPTGPVPDEARLVVVANAAALLEDPFRFAEHAVQLRQRAGYGRLLYAPGVGRPDTAALLAYLGVDLVDSAPLALAARAGEYLTPEGPLEADELEERPCACPACIGDWEGAEALRVHAEHALAAETTRVREAVRAGDLRQLVSSRVRGRPEWTAHLRRLDHDHYPFLEERTPVLRRATLEATAGEDLHRPAVRRFRERLATRYEPPDPARVLVLLPCSHRKPYSTSKTHGILQKGLDVPNAGAVHEAVLTSPLGVVPRDLEHTYPAAHYDLPVTGTWTGDEEQVVADAVRTLVQRGGYDEVLVHLDEKETDLAEAGLEGFVRTAEGDDPLSEASLDRLRSTLRKTTDDLDPVEPDRRVLADLTALARYQFGEAGEALTGDASVRGRAPWLKIDDATGEQLAMHVPERGLLSLTMEGGRRLAEEGAYWVEIEDFQPEGSVFAVGVTDADERVRVEDDVVVAHDGHVRAVGRACMPGAEMVELERGEAVRGRHHA
jgi:archaeosine synthase